MSFVVNITDDALDDLRRNADWWAQHHSAEQAITYGGLLNFGSYLAKSNP